MPLTARGLNRATLARQGLLRREPMSVVEAVRRVTALQAQEPASPYLALWNRVEGFDPADLDRAFADQTVVKATLMRVTLHAVAAEDYPALHEAMQVTLRGARLYDQRFRRTGLTLDDAGALMPEVLEHLRSPRSNAEAEAWLDERIGQTPRPGVWWAMRQYGPFIHVPTGGPWGFGSRPAYIGAPAALRESRPTEIAAAAVLVRRYLEAFGPATAQDIAQFGMLYAGVVRGGIEGLGDELVTLDGPGRTPWYDVSGAPLPDAATAAPPRLLPMWDSILLAYRDRSRIIPEAYRRLVIQGNGDALPTLLVDGYVAGVWRPLEHGIEATAFHPLADDVWAGLDAEARALRAFLAHREPLVYGRYARWWQGLKGAAVRIIGS
ncbi:MAG: winged helix DNA-binding domain-containing protein [Chloroflexota bacterium]